ncbi:beta-ketoacyl synthase chain length factor [Streptomyces sp. NPDC003011]
MTTSSPYAAAPDLMVLHHVEFPGPGDTVPTPVAGFIASSFAPLVAEAADRCLRPLYGDPPVGPSHGGRTAVVIVSVRGDQGTAAAVARAVDTGQRVAPLLFFQSVPNAIAGKVAARWGLTGPVVCTSPVSDPLTDGRALASLIVQDGDADDVLLILVEQDDAHGGLDRASALVLGRPDRRPAGTFVDTGETS